MTGFFYLENSVPGFFSRNPGGGRSTWRGIPPPTGGGQVASSLTQYGITWTFDKEYTVGQFVTGDWWVLGPVTITSITPASSNAGGADAKNGSMVNPVYSAREQAYDEDYSFRIPYVESKNAALNVSASNPLVLANDSSLVSSISNPGTDPWSANTQIKQFAVLTVLPGAPAADAFRPTYIGSGPKTIKYRESDLDYTQLGTLTPPASAPSFESVLAYDQNGSNRSGCRRPWIDYLGQWSQSRMFPVTYGQYLSNNCSDALLLLNCNYTNAQKRELLIHVVQGGIDIYEAVVRSQRGAMWIPDGGNGEGRKMPALLAGKVLGDNTIINTIAGKSPLWFAEDGKTFYVTSTHPYVGYGTTACPCPPGTPEFDWKYYGTNQCRTNPSACQGPCADSKYRKCCTTRFHFGAAMAAMIMGLRSTWGHEAFFEYVDRYRQWTALPQPPQFHRDMYDTYRDNYTPAKKTWEHS